MEPLKELFNKNFYVEFAEEFNKADKNFNPDKFVKQVTQNFEVLSLNQRLRNTSEVLKQHLPQDYKKAIDVLYKVIPNTKKGYTNLVFPDFVGVYGHNDNATSLEALKYFTQFGSSEFAIREFLKRDFIKTIKVLNTWAKDKSHHVRRLASEGSRPRLPWSFKLDEVIRNPKSTQTILETLREDEELYVKKSVANHLNDLSKDNTDYMLQLIRGWDRSNAHTAWIVKHASRTLIKKGNVQSLAFFDFEKKPKIKVENFKIIKPKIKLGDNLHFEFDISSQKSTIQKLVIDYTIHYRKSSGELSPKVFKLKEFDLGPNQKIKISKKQLIKDFTTRKHFAGTHFVELQVNGTLLNKLNFELIIK